MGLADFARTVRVIAFWKMAARAMKNRPCLKAFAMDLSARFRFGDCQLQLFPRINEGTRINASRKGREGRKEE
jgi:hypothetical protein